MTARTASPAPGLRQAAGRDWQFNGGTRVPCSGRFAKADIANWFGHVCKVDDVQSFEPREFIAGGEHVTVIGWERCAARPSTAR